MARQPYYRWLRNPITHTELEEAYRANALFDAHLKDPEYGHRLLADSARRSGVQMSDRTAWKITSDNEWWSVFGKKKAKNGKKPGPPVHDDLCAYVDDRGRVRHRFTATGLNQLWLTDITEHHTGEGKLYTCAIKDVCGNRIVGYASAARMTDDLAVRALKNAVRLRGNVAGCVVHSDREVQFRSKKFRKALTRYKLVGSMGRVGAAGDNAAMESFFALLQNNVLDRQAWTTRDELRVAIMTWIERTYHRRRRQTSLGDLTPIEYETMISTNTAKAA